MIPIARCSRRSLAAISLSGAMLGFVYPVVAAGKGILAAEKPDAIVVMLGLNDRVSIREPVSKADSRPADKKETRVKPDAKPGEAKPGVKSDGAAADLEQVEPQRIQLGAREAGRRQPFNI